MPTGTKGFQHHFHACRRILCVCPNPWGGAHPGHQHVHRFFVRIVSSLNHEKFMKIVQNCRTVSNNLQNILIHFVLTNRKCNNASLNKELRKFGQPSRSQEYSRYLVMLKQDRSLCIVNLIIFKFFDIIKLFLWSVLELFVDVQFLFETFERNVTGEEGDRQGSSHHHRCSEHHERTIVRGGAQRRAFRVLGGSELYVFFRRISIFVLKILRRF